MPSRGKEKIRGIKNSNNLSSVSDLEIDHVEMKEIHGQMVSVKICVPKSSTNPILLYDPKSVRDSANLGYELGPPSNGSLSFGFRHRSPGLAVRDSKSSAFKDKLRLSGDGTNESEDVGKSDSK